MSVFAPAKLNEEWSKVHNSEYIKTENEDKPDEDIKPVEPITPGKPEAE
jgi:hypothetical protein